MTDLQRLIDRQDIAELLYAYCREVDLLNPKAITELFTPDAVGNYGERLGGTVRGHDELLEFFSGLSTLSATSHHLTNIVVDFEGPDVARVESVLYAWHQFPGDAPDAYVHGRYRDRVVRTPAGWRFAERVLCIAGQSGFGPLAVGADDGGWNMIGRAGA